MSESGIDRAEQDRTGAISRGKGAVPYDPPKLKRVGNLRDLVGKSGAAIDGHTLGKVMN